MDNTLRIRRGEVYIFDVDQKQIPHLIIQNDVGNKYSSTTIALPLRALSAQHQSYVSLEIDRFRRVEQENAVVGKIVAWEPRTLDKRRIRSFVGAVSEKTISEINALAEENLNVNTGKVCWVDLAASIGSEQGGVRPCLVTENKNGQNIAVPVTKALHLKKNIPTHVFLDKSDFVDIRYSIDQESILLWEQQRFVAPNDIKSYIGWLNEDAKQKNVTPAKISVGLM